MKMADEGGQAAQSKGSFKAMKPFGRDNSSHKVPEAKGGKMGGSITNLSHSFSGASAKQTGV